MREQSINRLVLTALFIALTAIATMVITIPVVGTGGFINFGDVMIFVAAILLGPQAALLAGALGSALADMLLGYAIWAPYTLVVKGLEGLIAGLLAYRMFSGGKPRLWRGIAGLVLAGTWMAFGYFVAGGIMYGFEVSLTGIPGDLFQGYVSAAVAIPLALAVGKVVKPFKAADDDQQ